MSVVVVFKDFGFYLGSRNIEFGEWEPLFGEVSLFGSGGLGGEFIFLNVYAGFCTTKTD